MQKECSQCGKQFESKSGEEGMLCPACALGSFRRADTRETPSPEWERQQETMLRRQIERARKLGRVEMENKGLRSGQIVMLLLSGGLVLTDTLLFWISSRAESGLLAGMPVGSQRAFSLFLCVVAAVLLFLAAKRRPVVSCICSAAMLVWGWVLPDLWPSGDTLPSVSVAAPAADSVDEKRETVLDEVDLRILEEARERHGGDRIWGVYVDTPSDGAREQIRKFLSRLSRTDRVIAYSRGNGLLYVLEGTSVSDQDVKAMAGRLGSVLSFSPEKRLVETRFDARESHYENGYPSEVLLTVTHPSFVRANLEELLCLDPARIVSAAQNLETARSADFRADIRTTLLDVLREPWDGQEYVQKALVQAMLAYEVPGAPNYQVLEETKRMFETLQRLNLGVPASVIEYLVSNDPDFMVEPLIELWIENSVYWEPWLSKLGTTAQPKLLHLLGETQSLQTIGGILKHLEREGTAEALQVVRQFENHGDDLIRKAAHEAASEISKRINGQ